MRKKRPVSKSGSTRAELQKKLELQSGQVVEIKSKLKDAQIKYRAVTQSNTELRKKESELNDLREETSSITELNEKLENELTAVGSKASVQESLSKSVISERDYLKNRNFKLSVELHDLELENQRLKSDILNSKKDLIAVKNTLSYQLGYALIFGFKSWKAFFKLPYTLVFIRKDAVKRRASTSIKSLVKVDSSPVKNIRNKAKRVAVNNSQFSTLDFDLFSNSLKKLKVACIMDEFTYNSYAPECNLLQLTPQCWLDELEIFKPDFLMVESAWRGKDDLWGSKVGHKSDEVVAITEYCKDNKVPSIFWNKEDPIHFETFISTAQLFDYIFTTDIDCVARYKAALGHDRVYFLPFAAQPKVNNPIEKYQRKDGFCFAGAYYAKYPERTKDLGNFILSFPEFKSVDIYDRNYGKTDSAYQFPKEYQPYIVGTLPFSEIDKAYKGYRYSINLNSIKQSQSMFARRVFELLASNTITVSNFSRGLRKMFGELVVTSDSGQEIVERLKDLENDAFSLDKFRVQALRKVMTEHTYQDRLAYVASKISQVEDYQLLPSAVVFSYVKTEQDFEKVVSDFKAQQYVHKSMVVVVSNGFEYQGGLSLDLIEVVAASEAEQIQLEELNSEDAWLSVFVPEDVYGPYYLTDLVLATRYSDSSTVGKKDFYYNAEGELGLTDYKKSLSYTYVNDLDARSSLHNIDSIENMNLRELATKVYNLKFTENCFSVDRFSYCRNSAGLAEATLVDIFEFDFDAGYQLSELYQLAETTAALEESVADLPVVTGKALNDLLIPSNGTLVKHNVEYDHLSLVSNIPDGKHEYWYFNKLFQPSELNDSDNFEFYLETSPGLNLQLLILYLDENKERVGHSIHPSNRNICVDLPAECHYLKFGLRIYASGMADIKALYWGYVAQQPPEIISQNNTLVLTNNYPSYDDLYKNAFVHARVKGYFQSGLEADVLRFKADAAISYHEFEGVDVVTGGEAVLEKMLASGRYQHIAVHFLDEAMWQVLVSYIDRVKVSVWLHGSDIQSYKRRTFLYETDEQLNKARAANELKQNFWKSILSPMHENLHLVFVSKYLADTVQEDLGVMLMDDQFSVIHNPIDTELFSYIEKPIEQRKKILSIRPYASKVYANDLSVKAILELSKKDYFGELEFRLIGDGPLFDEVLEPLRKFSNVIIEKRFLSRSEIANLHKQYGVFLCPSRMDTQGVSRDEAMSSGLVPVTNAVAAIPEFVDQESGCLTKSESYIGLANAIEKLYLDENKFSAKSECASKKVLKSLTLKEITMKEKNRLSINL